MKKIITLLLVLTFTSFATSYNTITINGTNAEWAADEDFTDISSADNAYFTWDADYLYFGIADPEADYGNMATFMYFDTNPGTANGTTDAYAWGNNIVAPFPADYVVVWKNQSGGDYIEVRQWNSGTTSWDQVASATASSLSSGDYVVDFAVAAEPDGNYREVRIKRSTIGSPTKIKVASFTEQQWASNWRYFAWPSADWTDQNRGAAQAIGHYYGYTLVDGLAPDDVNAYDAVLVKGDYGNDYAISLNGTSSCFTVSDAPELDVTGDFTIEAWVYINDNVASSRFIVDRASNWQFYIISQSVRFDLQGGDLITTGTLALNQWHHVAVVRKGTSTSIYANGEVKQSDDLAIVAGDQGCVIGGQDAWFSGTLTSLIDEVKFSNTALYQSAFSTSTTTPLGSENSTIFYFQFEGNTELPPVDDGPLSLVTVNGRPAGSYPMTGANYVAPPAGLPLPVELTSFTALPQGEFVNLTWETATEVNNYGFEIERSVVSDQRSANWENVGFVEGHGNSNSVKQYSFTDNTVIAGQSYSYRLKQIDFDGQFEYSSIVNVEAGIPTEFNLEQNYPNPFNPATSISFSLPKAAQVNLSVYNVLGEKVAQLINTQMEAGKHTINFNASNLSTGTYIYRIETPEFSTSKKMMLVK